ncbi:hypothetical protein [Chryseobacterium indoltheticum]|nr:hypothetical protein [Chryseobacterium indoltheticum]
MKKNLLLRLCLIMSAILALSSCIHDEVYSSSDPSSTEYTNKTLWKQDEKYIKNVLDVYSENENDIRKGSGVPLWDYATTVESFDESFLMVPVVEDNKVVSVLQVPRKGDKVHFYYTNFAAQISFFQGLVFAKHKKVITRESSVSAKSISCTTQSFAIWYPADESNPDPESGEGSWGTRTIVVCRELLEDCAGIVDEFGQCPGGGGGDPPGFPYPGGGNNDPEEEETPCEKVNETINDADFKNKFDELNTTSNFNLDHEVGYLEQNGQFLPAASTSCGNSLEAKVTTSQCITGIMHTHTAKQCNGYYSGRVPSWGDIMVFLHLPVVQAKNCLGSSKEAYHVTITSGGSYMIKYNNDNPPTNTNYNFEAGEVWYENALQKLENTNQSTQQNIENLFMEFIDTYANIDGLEVYKMEGNTAKKLAYNSTTKTTSLLPCP